MISIITATYNRGYIIENLYHSLQRQTCHDFEWVVIDDGSNDNTFELVSSWKVSETLFPIWVFKQENGGKHRAVNFGVSKAKGDWCFIVDSDDMLSEDAVETIKEWTSLAEPLKHIAAVAGQKGRMGSSHFPIGGYPVLKPGHAFVDAKNTERRKLNLLGDKAEIYRTKLLKKYPFKTFEGENFMSECTVWDEIAYQGYYVRWYSKVIYYCDYLTDGLTQSGDVKEKKNFNGFTYLTQQRIKCHGLIEGIIARGYYYSVCNSMNKGLKEAAKNLNSSRPIIYLCYQLWKLKNVFYNK